MAKIKAGLQNLDRAQQYASEAMDLLDKAAERIRSARKMIPGFSTEADRALTRLDAAAVKAEDAVSGIADWAMAVLEDLEHDKPDPAWRRRR